MDQRTIQLCFALLRSVICSVDLNDTEKALFSEEQLPHLMAVSKKHDISHLVALGLKQNSLISKDDVEIDKSIFKAVYRYEQLNYEYKRLCSVLESAGIDFIPLKGSVLRKYYPEPWMRTSCDIDILVHSDALDRATAHLVKTLKYVKKERTSHDISLFSPGGRHIELHFDLVEEGKANRADDILNSVWKNVSLRENYNHWYEMTDEFFYFYHIAHMAKHFGGGGCGIRPFIDLWILDRIGGVNQSKRDVLLTQGNLLQFANAARKLSRVWFDQEKADKLSLKMQKYILYGGVYGSADNRLAVQQNKRGGRIGYILYRIFVPYVQLKRFYPILERHRWLTPFFRIRHWFRLLNPDTAKRAKREVVINRNVQSSKVEEMKIFLEEIGL